MAAAMTASMLPPGTITAGAADDDPIAIYDIMFRAHPSTSSIFQESVPNNMLWVMFRNRIDHDAAYDSGTKTYELDGKFYQLEISRPEHGPSSSQHSATMTIPDNGIVGYVSDQLVGGDNKHRYHGWSIDTELFDQDESNEYKVGGYTATLKRLNVGSKDKIADCRDDQKEVVGESKSLTIVDVTYRLSETDKKAGYQLQCPNEKLPSESINELAMEGDWITMIDPELDISTATAPDKENTTISGWKIVGGDDQPKKFVGDKIPSDTVDGTKDNKITLEAVLSEKKNYNYVITKNTDGGEAVTPTFELGDNKTATIDFNDLTDDPVEYEPTATIKPLTLRLVNTGNQRSYIVVGSRNDNFTFKLKNVNTDEAAKKTYADGGLDANNAHFYIPSQADINNGHDSWKNYALLEITPKQGLTVGSHHGQFYTFNYTSSYRVENLVDVDIEVKQREVDIAPHDVEKNYGDTLTQDRIICDVYDGGNIIESNKSAQELGVTVKSDGIEESAAVKKDGGKYPFTLDVTGTGNYKVKLKDGVSTGITVIKTTPTLNKVTASGINEGSLLSASKLSGTYVNRYSHQPVEGTLAWVKGDELIETSGSISRKYQFTPQDLENYDMPDEASTTVVVSSRRPVNLRVVDSLAKKYDGTAQTPKYAWDRGSAPTAANLDIKYKKVSPDDTTFAPDENYDLYTDQPIDAGTYKVHATCTGNDIFAPGLVDSIMTISPRPLELNVYGSIKTKTYDGTDKAEIDMSKVKFKNAIASDNVTLKADALTATFSSTYVEPSSPKQVKVVVNGENALEGEDAANYTLASTTIHTTGKLSEQRPIRLALTNGSISKPYGAVYTFSTSDYKAADSQPANGGLVAGESMSDLRATLTAVQNGVDGTSATAPIGSYNVTASTLKGDRYNYAITADTLGTLNVVQATPVEAGTVSATNGVVGKPLSSVNLTGTFRNADNSSLTVEGSLKWQNPNETLTAGTKTYEWIFTPNDKTNYKTVTGRVSVTSGTMVPAPFTEFTVPENAVYDGKSHPATVKTSVSAARITIEYLKTDIALHASTPTGTWSQVAPVDAGTYEVRATIHQYGDYAENSQIKTMTILQAEPSGGVSASRVDKGAMLSDSALTHTFKGVKGESLAGILTWNTVGTSSPTTVSVDPNTDYGWVFVPSDSNYKTKSGTARVAFLPNTRAPEAEIYNLPDGDYAYVNVDGKNLKAGDVVTFYTTSRLMNPESESVEITSNMSGKIKIHLDSDALSVSGGTLYVNIKDSETAKAVPYKPEVGFTINPTLIYVKKGESSEATIIKSDDSYTIDSVSWHSNRTDIVIASNGSTVDKGILQGVDDGPAQITATVVFNHPDANETGKITVSGIAGAVVTAEEPPKYTYTTGDAADITQTSALLKGSVAVERAEGSTISPYASCMFRIWEKGTDAVRTVENGTFLTDSGDYSITVSGLTPQTTYQYKAIGADSEAANTAEFTTAAIPTPVPTPTPTPIPTTVPTEPTAKPIEPTPTPTPTTVPTTTPTTTPTDPTTKPTAAPTDPTANPTANPTAAPTNMPTPEPIEDVEIVKAFEGKLEIKESVNAEKNEVVFDIEVKENIPELQHVQLFKAEYDDDGRLTGIKIGVNTDVQNGHITIKTELPDPEAAEYKYMLWAQNDDPIIKAITQIQ